MSWFSKVTGADAARKSSKRLRDFKDRVAKHRKGSTDYAKKMKKLMEKRIEAGGQGYSAKTLRALKRNYANILGRKGAQSRKRLKNYMAKRGMSGSSQEVEGQAAIDNQVASKEAQYGAQLDMQNEQVKRQDYWRSMQQGFQFDQFEKNMMLTFDKIEQGLVKYEMDAAAQKQQMFWGGVGQLLGAVGQYAGLKAS